MDWLGQWSALYEVAPSVNVLAIPEVSQWRAVQARTFNTGPVLFPELYTNTGKENRATAGYGTPGLETQINN